MSAWGERLWSPVRYSDCLVRPGGASAGLKRDRSGETASRMSAIRKQALPEEGSEPRREVTRAGLAPGPGGESPGQETSGQEMGIQAQGAKRFS